MPHQNGRFSLRTARALSRRAPCIGTRCSCWRTTCFPTQAIRRRSQRCQPLQTRPPARTNVSGPAPRRCEGGAIAGPFKRTDCSSTSASSFPRKLPHDVASDCPTASPPGPASVEFASNAAATAAAAGDAARRRARCGGQTGQLDGRRGHRVGAGEHAGSVMPLSRAGCGRANTHSLGIHPGRPVWRGRTPRTRLRAMHASRRVPHQARRVARPRSLPPGCPCCTAMHGEPCRDLRGVGPCRGRWSVRRWNWARAWFAVRTGQQRPPRVEGRRAVRAGRP